jgi:hypothetical protein
MYTVPGRRDAQGKRPAEKQAMPDLTLAAEPLTRDRCIGRVARVHHPILVQVRTPGMTWGSIGNPGMVGPTDVTDLLTDNKKAPQA